MVIAGFFSHDAAIVPNENIVTFSGSMVMCWLLNRRVLFGQALSCRNFKHGPIVFAVPVFNRGFRCNPHNMNELPQQDDENIVFVFLCEWLPPANCENVFMFLLLLCFSWFYSTVMVKTNRTQCLFEIPISFVSPCSTVFAVNLVVISQRM